MGIGGGVGCEARRHRAASEKKNLRRQIKIARPAQCSSKPGVKAKEVTDLYYLKYFARGSRAGLVLAESAARCLRNSGTTTACSICGTFREASLAARRRALPSCPFFS